MDYSKKMPQFPEPFWRESIELPSFPKLEHDLNVEVAIVGGGISGLTTAYLLAKEGKRVAVLEASNILNGTTGHTTAKVTAQHGVIFDELISKLGFEQAKLYYEANDQAITFVKDLVNAQNIDCDFSVEDAYIYTNSQKEMQNVINEYKAYEKIGIPSAFAEEVPIPVKSKAAVIMKNQAQFHPLKYLKYLVQFITENGGQIFEKTTAVDIEKGDSPKVKTRNNHVVTCDQLVVTSHFPFYDLAGFYFSRMYASRSYVLAVKTKKEFPGGMYINAEQPTRSLRYTMMDGNKLVLFGGGGHKTGRDDNTFEYYEALEAFADETFGIEQIPYRWSAQDLTTLDKVPYVGQFTSNTTNIYVATGYRKWGMTNSTAASLLLADLILERPNPYKELYSPSRFHADPSVTKFLSYNAQVAKELINGKIELPNKRPEDLNSDEGAAVTINGKRAGAYKDKDGALHIVDTTCTHMGCELKWNNGDRTWDCPCHGSRFSYTGEVFEGPAEIPLKAIDED